MDDDRAYEHPHALLWLSMADQFLDSEERMGLPAIALTAVELGLSPEQARSIWRHEVTPVVGYNLRDPFGTWGAWDKDWLMPRIQEVAEAEHTARRAVLELMHLCRPRAADSLMRSIERFMRLLSGLPAEDRHPTTHRLGLLAAHAVDVPTMDLSQLEPSDRQALRQLWPHPFWNAFSPALLICERQAAYERIEDALAGRRGGKIPRARLQAQLLDLLVRIRTLVSNSTDYCWSSWEDQTGALRELDALIDSVYAGAVPSLLHVLFLPTGDLQEVSMQNGWSDEYLTLSSQFDDLYRELRSPESSDAA